MLFAVTDETWLLIVGQVLTTFMTMFLAWLGLKTKNVLDNNAIKMTGVEDRIAEVSKHTNGMHDALVKAAYGQGKMEEINRAALAKALQDADVKDALRRSLTDWGKIEVPKEQERQP